MKKDTLPNLSTKAARKATINFNLFFFVFPLCLTVRFEAIIWSQVALLTIQALTEAEVVNNCSIPFTNKP